MKKKKLAVLCIVVCACAAFCFAGCGTKQEDPIADGTLSIGTNATYVPLEYRDDQNNLVGFDKDLGDALAQKLGVKSEWVDTAWDGIFNGLGSGQYDCIISGVSITSERQKNFYMTDPYIANGIVIVSRKDGTAATKASDLNGKKVGVQIETTADTAAEAMKTNDGNTMEISKFDGMMDAFAALEGKTVDYILTDEPVGQYYTSLKPDVYSVTSDSLSNEPIGICMKKGDTEFGDKVNQALKDLKDDGTMAKLSQKWFKKDLTQNISTDLKTIE